MSGIVIPATLTLEEMQRALQSVKTALQSGVSPSPVSTDLRGTRMMNAGASVGDSDYTTRAEVLAQGTALKAYIDTQLKTQIAAAVKTVPGSPTGPTPPPPTAPPVSTTPPSGVPTAGTLTRGFDLTTATVENSPTDIASWPVTGTISAVTVASVPGQNGVFVTCDKISPAYASPPVASGLWPQDPTAYPDAVNLQYTLWVLFEVSGTWYTSGFVQMWVGRPGTGSTPMNADWTNNWAYSSRWGPLFGSLPTFGSTMGFFLSAGNARGQTGVTTVRERSEVVMLTLPADTNGGTYS